MLDVLKVVCLAILFIIVSFFISGCQYNVDKGNSNATYFKTFGTVIINDTFELDGVGLNIDSIAFWEAPNSSETLMFVTGKENNVIEVWKYPFLNNELSPLIFQTIPNGVAVDQEKDRLFVAESGAKEVTVFSLPSLRQLRKFGKGIIGDGETNLAILKHSNNQTWAYVTDDHNIYVFNADTGKLLHQFQPQVSSIETILADSYYQIIYVPEELGGKGKGTGIHAYYPNGTLFKKNNTNIFGEKGVFGTNDEEGIGLYKCLNNREDNGNGFIIVAEQSSPLTEFEFFNRQTWKHLGTVKILSVRHTDGIALTQKPLPNYPYGLFAAVDADSTTAIVSLEVILHATGLFC